MVRTVLCALTLLGSLAAGPAYAACPRDARGDVRLTDYGPVSDAPHLDLAGADVALGRTELVVVMRTYGAPAGDGVWKTMFALSGIRYHAVAARGVAVPLDPDTQPGFRFGTGDGGSVPVSGAFDTARKEIRIRVKRADLPALRRPRLFLTDVAVEAKQKVVTARVADVSYVDRWSC